MADKHHHHHHHHSHEPGSLKGKIGLIVLTTLLLALAMLLEHFYTWETWQLLLVYLVPYLLIGRETLKEAVEGLLHGELFNEHFLMSLATIGALCIGFLPGAETEFPEAVFVMLFFQVGELFEGYAEGKSRDSISHLMDIRPDVAYVEREGRVEAVPPQEVGVGDVIVIKPGEKVPLDGVILDGTTSLNTLALTGESMPREVSVEDEVMSGCINLTGVIPAGDVLCRGVAGKHFVQVPVVQLMLHLFFDVGEVGHHAVSVQFAGAAMNSDDPVVAVQVFAFAGIGESQAVGGGDLHAFDDCIHI